MFEMHTTHALGRDDVLIPRRPWWNAFPADVMRSKDHGFVIRFTRRDGAAVECTYSDAVDEAGALSKYDAEHPAPHPGFRAGQVWLFQFPQVTLGPYVLDLAASDSRHEHTLFAHDAPFSGSPDWVLGRPLCDAIIGGRCLSRDEFDWLFYGAPSPGRQPWPVRIDAKPPDAFLLADPVNPSCAPWGPSETTRRPQGPYAEW